MRFVRPISYRRNWRSGFTLIEAALVTVIVGVGITSMVELFAAGTLANTQSTEQTTALGLASNIRELSLGVKYSNIMTLKGLDKSPPVDSRNIAMTGLTNWRQTVDVKYVDENRLTMTVPDTQVEPTARVTVTISHNGRAFYTSSWLATASEWP